jgi:hypothetical protein
MSGWYGGWTYGPRYVLPALPFLWTAAWLGFDRAGPRLRLSFGALAALGLATNLPAAFVDQQTHLELALGAARIEIGPELDESLTRVQRDDALFQAMQWDWRFAAPWAHWRILRHRLAGGREAYSASELFYVDSDAALTVSHDRQRGFNHLAWVDLAKRLDGPGWIGWTLALVLLALGIGAASDRGFAVRARP